MGTLFISKPLTSDFSTLKLEGGINDALTIELVSPLGVVVRAFKQHYRQSYGGVLLDVSDLAEGLYYVRVRAEKNRFERTLRLMVRS